MADLELPPISAVRFSGEKAKGIRALTKTREIPTATFNSDRATERRQPCGPVWNYHRRIDIIRGSIFRATWPGISGIARRVTPSRACIYAARFINRQGLGPTLSHGVHSLGASGRDVSALFAPTRLLSLHHRDAPLAGASQL